MAYPEPNAEYEHLRPWYPKTRLSNLEVEQEPYPPFIGPFTRGLGYELMVEQPPWAANDFGFFDQAVEDPEEAAASGSEPIGSQDHTASPLSAVQPLADHLPSSANTPPSPPRDDWDYAVEVWPGQENINRGPNSVTQHIRRIRAAFEKKSLDCDFSVQDPVEKNDLQELGQCRRYLLPRKYRDSERCRLQFLQVFNINRVYNKLLDGYLFKMSVVFEQDDLGTSTVYSSGTGGNGQGLTHFNSLNPNGNPTLGPSSSPTPSTSSLAPTTPPHLVEKRPRASKNTLPRMKPIPKPEREVVKSREGKFLCTWPDCKAKVKDFVRKCEWSKHMDKHERPYKCPAVGCENIPGFTYSGGLLRHEREVHRKHGGPKNPLFCPHTSCKRHRENCFARLENLNEHLRRCHTTTEQEPAAHSEEPETEYGTPVRASTSVAVISPLPIMSSPKTGDKRKADDDDLREEVKRLQLENQRLATLVTAHEQTHAAMQQSQAAMHREMQGLRNQVKAFTSNQQARPH
ncbi:hypothetical protein F5Y19DRAFT_479239 [Xylariaceae sp. FL1651]|nr:hypothetical protein F5Y19DRAFT_479239 [Xylariaceae sp. FL1651]